MMSLDEPPPTKTRRVRAWVAFIATWLVPALILVGVSAAAIELSAEDPPGPVERFFPLGLGTTWVYETTNLGSPTGKKTVQVVDKPILVVSELGGGLPKSSGTVSATTIASYFEDFLGGGPYEEIEYVRRVGSGLYSLGERANRGRFKVADPIQPLFEAPLTPGESFSYKGRFGNEIDSRSEVVEIETLAIAGRELSGCAEVHTDSAFTGGDGTVHEVSINEWLCPGVGRVRFEEKAPSLNVNYTEELVEFHSGERDFVEPETAPPQIEGPPPTGASIGMTPGRSNFVADADLQMHQLRWAEGRVQNSDWPVVGTDEVAVFAEEEGSVSVLDTTSGDIRWRVALEGPIVAPPTIMGSLVLVGDAAKNLYALDLETGAARWSATFSDVLEAATLAAGGVVVAPFQDRFIRGLDPATGEELWDTRAIGRILGAPALAGESFVVTDDFGGVTAYDAQTGEPVWQFEPGNTAATAAVAQDGLVVATDTSGVVSGVDASNGDLLWDHALRGYSIADIPPAADGDHVALASELATGENVVTAIDAATGDRLWETELEGDVSNPPTILGDEVIVVTDEAVLFEIDLVDGAITDSRRFPSVDGKTEISVAQPPGFADGAFIVSAYTSPPWGEVTHFALPAAGLASPNGAYLHSSFRPLPTTPLTRPIPRGDEVVFADFDGVVWSVGPDGDAAGLFRGQGQPKFAVPTDELLIAHDGQDVVGVNPGGEEAWRFPIGDSSIGLAPAVADGTAFVPLKGVGLFAVDTAESKVAWTATSPGNGLAPPLPSGDGGVFYGTGGLARYNAGDGSREWFVKGIETLNEMAVADGDLFLVGFDFNTDEVALMRVDGATGTEEWRTPWNPPLFTGPAASSDVVVASHDSGDVAGFDAKTGERLWSLRARSPLGAAPLIAGNRVVFVEGGRLEHIGGRDYRARVHDLKTGRFLGSFELYGALFLTATIGADGSKALVPANLVQQVLVELEVWEW